MAKVLLISYDNGSHLPFFPQNIFYLMGALNKKGHTVGVWHQDLHHGRPEALTTILDENEWNIVGLGFVAGYWQYRQAKELSRAVNKAKNRKEFRYVLGGHGPAAEPEWFMGKMEADAVVVGDGERSICNLADNNRRGIIQGLPCNDDTAPLECYQWFPLDIYRLIRWPTSERTDFCFPILSSRGCKWHCSFCYRMREGYHQRAVGAIIEEIKWLHEHAKINHFQFSDELLMGSKARTEEVCNAILNLPFKIKWDCNGRLNFATLTTLRLMKESGCSYVNYGIESLDQKILNQMGKGLTVQRIFEGVQLTLDVGLSPGLNFIWGFPGDSIENLWRCVDFLRKYDPCDELRTIRPVTPYPGTPLYRLAIEKGLLEGPEDFYERKHLNSDLFTVNFTDILTKQCHEQLYWANEQLVASYFQKRKAKNDENTRKLYFEGDTSFRGFRAV